jgi:hypothetical protein
VVATKNSVKVVLPTPHGALEMRTGGKFFIVQLVPSHGEGELIELDRAQAQVLHATLEVALRGQE